VKTYRKLYINTVDINRLFPRVSIPSLKNSFHDSFFFLQVKIKYRKYKRTIRRNVTYAKSIKKRFVYYSMCMFSRREKRTVLSLVHAFVRKHSLVYMNMKKRTFEISNSIKSRNLLAKKKSSESKEKKKNQQ
jgi:hypothetical protein